jgi:hypothetical protein
MYFGITLKGGEELDRKLREMEPKIANKLVKSGLKNALSPLKKAAILNALRMVGGEMGGTIAENIVTRALKRRKGSYGMGVMIRPDVPQFVHITKIGVRHYIPAAIEYGHAAPYTIGSINAKPGSEISRMDTMLANRAAKTVPARPFMRDAVDSRRDVVIALAAIEIKEAVEGK